MKKILRIAPAPALLAAGFLFGSTPAANAQVAFEGRFPLPHGSVSVSVGDPFFRVGVPVPWNCRVYSRAGYGYGFVYDSYWYPARRYRSRWIVAGGPYAYPNYGYGYRRYGHDYRYGYGRFERRHGHFGSRRGYFRDHGRRFDGGRHGHGRGHRRDHRW